MKKLLDKINIRIGIYAIAFTLLLALYFLTEARYVLLGIIVMFLMAVGACICMLLTGRSMEVNVDCPVQGYKDKDIPISIKVKNLSNIPVLLCQVKVDVTNKLTGKTSTLVKYLSVGHKREGSVDFNMKDSFSGCMEVKINRVGVSDSLGIFTKKAGQIVTGICKSYIMPEAAGKEFTAEEINSFDMESYKYSSISKGNDPSEVFNIKEYERGDSFKSIHWKLSTKLDELLIKESALPIENKVMIIVEKALAGIDPKLADEYTGIASSISYTMLKKEMYHTIGWYDFNSGKFESFRVYNEDTYWLAMKGLVECPYRDDEISAVSRFIGTDIPKEFSNYILISNDNRDIEELATYGAVQIYKPEDYR